MPGGKSDLTSRYAEWLAGRRARILDLLRPGGRVGVEIGPLTRPILRKDDGAGDGAVLYADHLSTEGLRLKYRDDPNLGPDGTEGLVPIDVVLDGPPLAQALGPRGPVDYVLASHVFEHVADPIGWLAEMACALREDGLLCLIVPDKRFTFDHFRTPTHAGEWVAAYRAGLTLPPVAAVYEHVARACPVDPYAVWRGRPVERAPLPGGGPAEALRMAGAQAEAGALLDIHCSVFTPASFAAVLAESLALDLVPLACAAIEPTRRWESEFTVLLRKSGTDPSAATAAERAATVPRLDPRRHHDLPRPAWTARLRQAGRARLRPSRTGA